jgi:ADP-heptose:LPS heptosyltransferase
MPARTYPWEMYAEVVNLLVEQLGARVILTGAKDEQTLVEQILSQVQEHNRQFVFGLAGALSFPEFCALIETTDLTLTNNTGPMHISAAVKTPVVALFALTNPPEQWGPWHVPHRQLYHDVPCRICYSRICPFGHECLRLVTPPMVVDAIYELLEETGKGHLVTLMNCSNRIENGCRNSALCLSSSGLHDKEPSSFRDSMGKIDQVAGKNKGTNA